MKFSSSRAPSPRQQELIFSKDLFSQGQPRTAPLAPQEMWEQREEAAVFWIGLPHAAEHLLACLILRSVQRLGTVCSTERGAKACETHHTSPSPGFKALNQLLSSPPGAPNRGGGDREVPNGRCIASPDASSLFSLNGTKLPSKRCFLLNS